MQTTTNSCPVLAGASEEELEREGLQRERRLLIDCIAEAADEVARVDKVLAILQS